MLKTALGMQLLGLAYTFSILEGSLGSLWMWNLDFRGKPEGFPWGVQLHLTTKKENAVCI